MEPRESRRTTFLAGLVVGLHGGILLGLWPVFGAALLIAFIVGAARARDRAAPTAGLLIGLPGLFITSLGMAAGRCSEFAAVPGQGCCGPDLTAPLAVAAGFLAIGLVLALRVAREGRSGSRARRLDRRQDRHDQGVPLVDDDLA